MVNGMKNHFSYPTGAATVLRTETTDGEIGRWKNHFRGANEKKTSVHTHSGKGMVITGRPGHPINKTKCFRIIITGVSHLFVLAWLSASANDRVLPSDGQNYSIIFFAFKSCNPISATNWNIRDERAMYLTPFRPPSRIVYGRAVASKRMKERHNNKPLFIASPSTN